MAFSKILILRGWPKMNAMKSACYRHPRESGGPEQLLSQIKRFPPACGGLFAARPWIPAFAGMTMRTQHIGKAQFISSQTLRSPPAGVSKDARHPVQPLWRQVQNR